MKILHLANTPLSNSPANIASVQNHCGHEARVLLNQKANRNKVYVGGDLWTEFSKDELETFFKEADIIHFHNFTWYQNILVANPFLVEIVKTKKCVVQFHSSRTAAEDFEQTIKDDFFKNKKLVIAQYHVREYPECEYVVPNPIPLHEERFSKLPKGKWLDVPPVWVSYAPSNAHLSGWDYKGYDKITPALKSMRNNKVNIEIIFGKPYEECLQKKRYSHLGIEEFYTGSYHLSFLEYMALDCAPVGYIDRRTFSAIESVVGDAAVHLPYYECRDSEQLKGMILHSANNPDQLRNKARQARKWLDDNWSSEITCQKYIDVYEKI